MLEGRESLNWIISERGGLRRTKASWYSAASLGDEMGKSASEYNLGYTGQGFLSERHMKLCQSLVPSLNTIPQTQEIMKTTPASIIPLSFNIHKYLQIILNCLEF